MFTYVLREGFSHDDDVRRWSHLNANEFSWMISLWSRPMQSDKLPSKLIIHNNMIQRYYCPMSDRLIVVLCFRNFFFKAMLALHLIGPYFRVVFDSGYTSSLTYTSSLFH